jgi:hypothetical protein
VLPSSSHELSPSSQSVPQDVPNSNAILSHFLGPKVEYIYIYRCVCVCVCELKRGVSSSKEVLPFWLPS